MKKYFVLLLLFFVLLDRTNAQISVWTGAAEMWTQGTGTPQDPYLIESAEHLAMLAYLVNHQDGWMANHKDTYFKLTVDLDLGGSNGLVWEPIGFGQEDGPFSYYRSFSGNFDGDYHTVNNMLINNDLCSNNLFMDKAVGLFGVVVGGSVNNITMLENCHIDIVFQEEDEFPWVGMVVGRVFQGSDCDPFSMTNCHNMGEIIIRYTDDEELGGIGGVVGHVCGPASFVNCSNEGDITVYWPMYDAWLSSGYPLTPFGRYIGPCLGGVVGVSQDHSGGWHNVVTGVDTVEFDRQVDIRNCYNTGDLLLEISLGRYEHPKKAYVGGIIGNGGYLLWVDRCYNKGAVGLKVNALDNEPPLLIDHCGGIVGGYGYGEDVYFPSDGTRIISQISNCYNHAPITCEVMGGATLDQPTTASGITGNMYVSNIAELVVQNCYHVGALQADEVYGIAAQNEAATMNVNNSYYDRLSAPENGVGFPWDSEEMKTQAFVNQLNNGGCAFKMDRVPYCNEGYPVLNDGSLLLNTVWYYEILNPNGSITYQYLEYTSDTTTSSHRAKVIVRTNKIYDKDEITVRTHEYIFEEDNVVYWWNKELQQFTVLYDFGADVGDEWEIKVGAQSLVMHVDAIDSIEYEGVRYRTLRVSDVNDYFSGDIVCGIGHLTSFFPERLMSPKSEYRVEGLRCFWHEDQLVFKLGDKDCDEVYQSYHNEVPENSLTPDLVFTLSPNPVTSGVLMVSIPHSAFRIPNYTIATLMGQPLLSGTICDEGRHHDTTSLLTIDVSSLSPGVYFITLGDSTQKFIIP